MNIRMNAKQSECIFAIFSLKLGEAFAGWFLFISLDSHKVWMHLQTFYQWWKDSFILNTKERKRETSDWLTDWLTSCCFCPMQQRSHRINYNGIKFAQVSCKWTVPIEEHYRQIHVRISMMPVIQLHVVEKIHLFTVCSLNTRENKWDNKLGHIVSLLIDIFFFVFLLYK